MVRLNETCSGTFTYLYCRISSYIVYPTWWCSRAHCRKHRCPSWLTRLWSLGDLPRLGRANRTPPRSFFALGRECNTITDVHSDDDVKFQKQIQQSSNHWISFFAVEWVRPWFSWCMVAKENQWAKWSWKSKKAKQLEITAYCDFALFPGHYPTYSMRP